MEATVGFFDKLLRILHPFMPFITEELWQNLQERAGGQSIMVTNQPEASVFEKSILDKFDLAREAIVNIRNIRQSKGISPKEGLQLYVKGNLDHSLYGVIQKMANIVTIDDIVNKDSSMTGITFISYTTEFFVPLEGLTNAAEEIKKAEAEFAHLQGFLKSVNAKLSNSRFVESAPPQVVEMEKKKRSDAESKMAKLQQLISDLTK